MRVSSNFFATSDDPVGAGGLAEVVTDAGGGGVDERVAVGRGLSGQHGVELLLLGPQVGHVLRQDRHERVAAVAGGGRYDNLVAQLSDGAVNLPAVGFAMGDVVLGELVASLDGSREKMDRAMESDRALDAFAIIAKEERRGDAMNVVQKLRDNGFRVDFPFGATKVGKQFQLAEQLGARTAILVGDEWPKLAVKDLKSGEQQLILHDDVLAHLVAISSSAPLQ